MPSRLELVLVLSVRRESSQALVCHKLLLSMIALAPPGNTMYRLWAMVAFSIPVISPRPLQRARILSCWVACWRAARKDPREASTLKEDTSKGDGGWSRYP